MRSKLSFQQDKRLTTVLFLVIPLTLFLVFFLYPLCYIIYLSFHEWNGLSPTMTPVGLKNYTFLLRNSEFLAAVKNNVKWLVFYIIIPPGLGLSLALLVDRGIRKGKSIFETIYFLPSTITLIAVAAIWKWMYAPGYGLLNEIFREIGLEGLTQNWLGNPDIATYSMMISVAWFGLGTPFLIYLAGLKAVPESLIEAAKIDGASFPKVLRFILLPMLAPSTAVVVALSALGAIKIFDLVYALTAEMPAYYSNVLAVLMYQVSFYRYHLGQGAAISVILFLLAVAIVSPYLAYTMRKIEGIRQ